MRNRQVAYLLAGLLAGAVIGFGVIFLGSGPTPETAQRLPPAVGAAASDFTLSDFDSHPVSLSDHKGRGVVINFWATWCPPCKEEMPLLEAYSQKYSGSLVVLGVNYQEQDDVVRKFVQENGIGFPLLLDRSGTVADTYYVHNFPATFFIDSQGIIRAQHLGLLTEQVLVRYLKTIGIEE